MALSSVLSMFAKSPIRPLQEHMLKAHSCATTLLTFYEAVHKQDWKTAEELQQKISHLEREADDLKRDLRLNLPKGTFLPVHRNDILELLYLQDGVANKAEDIAGLMLGRKMQFPEVITNQFAAFLQRAIDASAQAKKAINELDELLETGFRGAEVDLVEEMILRLNEIETDTDIMQIEIRSSLFKIEKDLPPIDVMFLYKIIEWVGQLADRAQQVGERLQLMLTH